MSTNIEGNICAGIYVYDNIPDCSEVMHGWISSVFSRSDGLADVHLAEVREKTVVHVPHMVWPGIGVSSLDHCKVLSRNTDASVPQSSLDHTVHRVTLHLCVTSFKVLLFHWLLLFNCKLGEGIAQEQVSVLVAASITPLETPLLYA